MAHQQVLGRSEPFSSCKESAQAYISTPWEIWTRSALHKLDRSSCVVLVQMYLQHVWRYVSFRRLTLQFVAESQWPLLSWA